MNKYFANFRNSLVMILAKTTSEALEPWRRINNNHISVSDFEKLLIDDPCTSDHLILVGNTVSMKEVKQICQERISVFSNRQNIKCDIKIEPIKNEIESNIEISETILDPAIPEENIAKNIEDFFEF